MELEELNVTRESLPSVPINLAGVYDQDDEYSYSDDDFVEGETYVPHTSLAVEHPMALPPLFATMSEAEQMVEVLLLETVAEVCEVDAYNVTSMLMQQAALARMDAWKVGTGVEKHALHKEGDTKYSAHIRTVIADFDAWVSASTSLLDQISQAHSTSLEDKRARYIRKKQARVRKRSRAASRVSSPISSPSASSPSNRSLSSPKRPPSSPKRR